MFMETLGLSVSPGTILNYKFGLVPLVFLWCVLHQWMHSLQYHEINVPNNIVVKHYMGQRIFTKLLLQPNEVRQTYE